MIAHFEELWETCEKLYQNVGGKDDVSSIIEELSMKVDFYRSLEKKELPENEKAKVKSRIMGEILLTLTHLSLKDNLNVFDSLNMAMQYKSLSK